MPNKDVDEDDLENSLLDATDRFERTLDTQIQLINDIDSKAEHVTRLIGVFIGALLSILAVAFRINNGEVTPLSTPIFVSFVLGIILLLLSMGGSIVTYLSSKFKIGLHYNPALLLSRSNYDTDLETHLRRTIGTYAYNLEKNESVIEVNSRRFRLSLVSLLCGVVFLSNSGILFIISAPRQMGWIALGVIFIASSITAWYILSGRYLTLDDQR